ncbi:hypothetical protein SEA_COEUR_6 [Gordonia phage Coeur]|uniref:Uncharacterized protein n=1 Tax=Gordonia phage Coeur TaxID=2571246 RepID=A0A4Y6EQN2_9CAUD|nr:hypothetical protein PQC60_gp06 [Gordonia phage Coeur]QDF17424.1 hypothetical protein SEA_COEUR_6 [Gordonia phage Coeur]WNO26668.1 membrane protein [Gordonia phage Rahul]
MIAFLAGMAAGAFLVILGLGLWIVAAIYRMEDPEQ